MQAFTCTSCGSDVFFDNSFCLGCGAELGFEPSSMSMLALIPETGTGGRFKVAGDHLGHRVRYCLNAAYDACNWLTSADAGAAPCAACALNRSVPARSNPEHLAGWRKVEAAKKRLVYALLRFGLPTAGSGPDVPALTFQVLPNATTGHRDGVVTIDVAEADAVERERRREHFDEPYRSLLGHLRHESGHYYWPVVVRQAGLLDGFRALFGDERADYGAALQAHHANGASSTWREKCVSAYATAHPWEDWAETWAHYLHIVDTVDTAKSTGMEPRAKHRLFGSSWPFARTDVYREIDFKSLVERWLPLATALNEFNRSMGNPDFYPFVMTDAVIEKLAFVHQAIRRAKVAPGMRHLRQVAAG